MKVSFIIPSYNSAKHFTDEKVRRLLSFGEVIVVDDGSTDNTREVIEKYEDVKYIYQKNNGPAAARNTGWKAASGETVCFVDADTSVEDESFKEKILKGFTDEKIAAVGGTYTIKNPDKFLPRFIHEEIVERHNSLPEHPRFLGSYLLAVRRKVLEEVGGFDESYPKASAEDNDLCYRIIDKGYQLRFDENLSVGHYHTESICKYLKEQARHGYYRLKLYRNHPGKMSGDDYAGVLDFIQPPLALVSVICVFAVVVMLLVQYFAVIVHFLISAAVFLLVLFMLQVPYAVRITKRLGKLSCLLIVFVTFLRSYARGFGMAAGFVKFFLLAGRRVSPSVK